MKSVAYNYSTNYRDSTNDQISNLVTCIIIELKQ